jgi:hypothetical protein
MLMESHRPEIHALGSLIKEIVEFARHEFVELVRILDGWLEPPSLRPIEPRLLPTSNRCGPVSLGHDDEPRIK